MKRLVIVDISSFIFRAFFAIRPLTAPDGTPVNAVHGIWNMMWKLLSKYQPTHIYLARDSKGETFRHKLYSEYKANRDEPPEDLVPQFPIIVELVEKMGLHNHAIDGFEADDLIGSACQQWKNDFDEILIASGDKDLMQFVNGKIKMVDTMKDKVYGPDEVKEKMGVRPEQIMDYLAIIGDKSDNIPGMFGIGAKGAAKLLEQYGTLDEAIKHKDELKGKRLINAFENHLDDARISRKLVEIKTNLNLGMGPSDTKFQFRPSEALKEFFVKYNFKGALKQIADLDYMDTQIENGEEGEFGIVEHYERGKKYTHHIVQEGKPLDELVRKIKECPIFALHTEYSSSDIYAREIVSLSISFDGKESYYLPFKHDQDLLSDEYKNISETKLFEILKLCWADSDKELIGEHFKRDICYGLVHGIDFTAKTFDVPQVHYVIDVGENHSFSQIAANYAHHTLLELDKKMGSLAEAQVAYGAEFSGERAVCLMMIAEEFKSKLKKLDLEKVYYEMDDPMIRILTAMEKEGVLINPGVLKKLEKEFTTQTDEIEHKVDEIVGEKVNLRSPKQLSVLLFEKLQLPIIKKGKTGPSTDVSVLEQLDAMGASDIPGLILKYRELDKLLSTYVKTLPELVNKTSGRIHTNFNQHVAQTGRLASINPNLQNIPVRTENGRKIRKAFIATPGNVLLSADYSQVELRILAHFSKDPTMIQAFKEEIDIHSRTASEVLGVDVDQVTPGERSKAKAVNFGLMYGQSSFGLSNALKISRREAKDYITMYFERFNRVKGYLDSLKELAEERGYAETMFGRKRFLPDIKSNNRAIKSQAERIAINSPIQGTAADIIKLAMIAIDEQLIVQGLKSKMILQVHDELIFEVPEDELEVIKQIVRDEMEGVVKMDVPLKVDMGIGVNWYDLK